jgi:putative transposase
MEYLRNRTEAIVVIEAWRRHYNDVRPHSSLGYLTPREFAQKKFDSTKTRERAIFK